MTDGIIGSELCDFGGRRPGLRPAGTHSATATQVYGMRPGVAVACKPHCSASRHRHLALEGGFAEGRKPSTRDQARALVTVPRGGHRKKVPGYFVFPLTSLTAKTFAGGFAIQGDCTCRDVKLSRSVATTRTAKSRVVVGTLQFRPKEVASHRSAYSRPVLQGKKPAFRGPVTGGIETGDTCASIEDTGDRNAEP